MENCRGCERPAERDPCEHCGIATRCIKCDEWLDGPFCRACGTSAPSPRAVHDQPVTVPQPRSSFRHGQTVPAPPPPWVDALPLDEPDDSLGGSLQWAFGALRRYAGPLALVSLISTGIGIAGLVSWLIAIAVGSATEMASISVAGWLLGCAVAFAALTWSSMGLARAWAMAVRGVPIRVGEALSLQRYPAFLLITILAAPMTLLTWWLGFGFAVAALLLVAGDGLSPSAALGRALTETCQSARRFFHTLLIGFATLLGQLSACLLASVVWWQVALGTTTSSFANAFSENSSRLRDADTNLTFLFGSLFAALLWVVVSFAVWNLTGLWAAAHLRRLTGRPVGTRVNEASQLIEAPR